MEITKTQAIIVVLFIIANFIGGVLYFFYKIEHLSKKVKKEKI